MIPNSPISPQPDENKFVQGVVHEKAKLYGYTGITAFLFGIGFYWYSIHGGSGDGPNHYGEIYFGLIAFLFWLCGAILSLIGLIKSKHSIPSWIAFLINLVPMLKVIAFLNQPLRY